MFILRVTHTTQFVKETDMPSDAQRVQKVKTLINSGFSHRLLLLHDIHTKHRLVSIYGCRFAVKNTSILIVICLCVGMLWRARVWTSIGKCGAKDGGEGDQ